MDSSAQLLADRLRGTLIAAAATPMTAAGEVDLDLTEAYFRSLVADGADGLAVLAHTGRGPYLSPEVRAGVIERAVAIGVPVIVGVGGSRRTAQPESVAAQAVVAAELGAGAVMVFPSEGDRLAEHDTVWRAAGLPVIAFDLYTRPCPPDVRRKLLAHPGVAGLKAALLSDAMACQEAIADTRAAGRLAITGEDRMFGPSLLWGAEAALVGIAAACVADTAEVMRTFAGPDLRAFARASARLDRLAAATFTEPMEGYVQRMLWLAHAEGRVPGSHAFDPYRPSLPEEERDSLIGLLP
ncbi:dihydrodipicolinate synthase family protein [Sinosporangium siamense]|uniref:4-hydroxy-tetrahydrodipicolinate synthase n=1 Tax=Sinosporangium siamense TaxID=1367973 RepID=A0A919RI75_9ACTN|nr:dihydrodipicolinate synthase family protein [Sinosporangium siamense]GII92441.1 4-hydroxy-tetrahydrodipicolinate synthase [Sinosporangium siamense]